VAPSVGMRGGHANELQSTPCVIHDGRKHRQAAGVSWPANANVSAIRPLTGSQLL
jgi:hypothetical protein